MFQVGFFQYFLKEIVCLYLAVTDSCLRILVRLMIISLVMRHTCQIILWSDISSLEINPHFKEHHEKGLTVCICAYIKFLESFKE